MDLPDETLLEDWQGLESEMERLLIVYGYPTQSDCSLQTQEINTEPETIMKEHSVTFSKRRSVFLLD